MIPEATNYREIRIAAETRRAEAIERSERYSRSLRAAIWLAAFLGYAAGIVVILLSYHLDSIAWAQVAFWGGLAICFGAPLAVWIIAFTLGRDRGWFE